jgi:predicted XRE-type DNA-binding protein
MDRRLSNKEIADKLGLAHSTIRVLMARAAHKFGVRKRKELLATIAAKASLACVAGDPQPGDPGASPTSPA